ncbi:hypothetical protein CerSpe_106940 [Prunus speciosa]
MEQNNLPVVAKKIWSIVRVAFFMLRKGISKRKLLLDLNMMMKRGKLARKALSNLMFHHHHHHSQSHSHHCSAASSAAPREYEFSCSNTPNYTFHLMGKRRHQSHHHNFFACAHAPPTQDDDVVAAGAVKAVLEMLNNEVMAAEATASVTASPLPGFGKSPMVRQLRITDSPFPLREADEDSHVDKAAEEFIEKFYKNLWQQNRMHD